MSSNEITIFAGDVEASRLSVAGKELRYCDDAGVLRKVRLVAHGTLRELKEYDSASNKFLPARRTCKGVSANGLASVRLRPNAKFDVSREDLAGFFVAQSVLAASLPSGTPVGRMPASDFGLESGVGFQLKGYHKERKADGGVPAVGLCANFKDLYWQRQFGARTVGGEEIDDFLAYAADADAGLAGVFQFTVMLTEGKGQMNVSAFLDQADECESRACVEVRTAQTLPIPLKRQKIAAHDE